MIEELPKEELKKYLLVYGFKMVEGGNNKVKKNWEFIKD